MDFELSEEQADYRDEIARVAREQLNADVAERDRDGVFSAEAWRRCAGMGIQGLPIPQEYGGSGGDPLTITIAMEGLGYGCTDNGLLFSLTAHMCSCEIPILRFGSPEQRSRYLPGLSDGSLIGVQAMTEPESGSDAFSLRTTATEYADGVVLSGVKSFITNASVADVFVVFATSDSEDGLPVISAYLVDSDARGLTVGPPLRKMGLHTSPMSEVVFDACEVPVSNRLGRRGAGSTIFNASMEWERSHILASAVGTMQRHLEQSISYARERRQFGRPIGSFQAVSHRIVDMKIRLETARLLLYKLAARRTRGRRAYMEAAMTKLYVSECFVQSGLDAIQIHGAYGYTEEAGFERDLRDAIGGRLYSGTSEIQRSIVAGMMGL